MIMKCDNNKVSQMLCANISRIYFRCSICVRHITSRLPTNHFEWFLLVKYIRLPAVKVAVAPPHPAPNCVSTRPYNHFYSATVKLRRGAEHSKLDHNHIPTFRYTWCISFHQQYARLPSSSSSSNMSSQCSCE